jgi:glycosyltransferase involved in cell wall biosynthesis
LAVTRPAGPLLSVVIPARNAAATIGCQLAALAEQDHTGPWEIIVVDGRSTDATSLVVREWLAKLPHLQLVGCDAIGANCARNVGVHAARGSAILFCDADDVVARDWVREMERALDSFDIVGGRLEYSRLNRPQIRSTRAHLASEALPVAIGMRYAVSANLGFRRRVFDEVGGFDESFGTGSDEIDFCLRAQYTGCTIGFAREAVVHYRLRESLRALARQFYTYAVGNAQLYRKHTELQGLEVPSLRHRLGVIRRHVRRLLRVRGLRNQEVRWIYVRDTAWSMGVLMGLVRYRILT